MSKSINKRTEEELKTNFSKRLRRKMEQKPIKQNELANLMGLPETTISSWCRGSHMPDITRAIAIAEILGCSLDYLLMGKSCETKKGEFQSDRDISLENAVELIKGYGGIIIIK